MDNAQSGAQTSPFDTRKEEVMLQLAEKLIDAYDNKTVNYYDMKEASTYILKKMKKVSNEQELTYFLQNVSAYWPVFKDILVVNQSPALRAEEQQVIAKLSEYLKNSSTK